jgi:hypothetical protein
VIGISGNLGEPREKKCRLSITMWITLWSIALENIDMIRAFRFTFIRKSRFTSGGIIILKTTMSGILASVFCLEPHISTAL